MSTKSKKAPKDKYLDVARFVKNAIESSGLSLNEIAKRSGMPSSTLSDLCKGFHFPRNQIMLKNLTYTLSEITGEMVTVNTLVSLIQWQVS